MGYTENVYFIILIKLIRIISIRVKRNQTGTIKRLVNALKYSLAGLSACFKNEQAFRQEVYLCLILIPFALLSSKTNLEKIFLVTALLLVLIIEVLNSAIEALTDRISSEEHPLSKIAKDAGSAAVLLGLILAAFTWAIIFLG